MWLRATDGQWINTAQIVRIYLHDVHENPGFGTIEEARILGRRALVDLTNSHTVTLAFFPDNGDLETRTAKFIGDLQTALTQTAGLTDFCALGYEALEDTQG